MSTTSGEGSIEIVRELRATPDRVFRALTQAKDLEAWWGAKTQWWLEKAQVDARPGGRYHLDFRSGEGKIGFVE